MNITLVTSQIIIKKKGKEANYQKISSFLLKNIKKTIRCKICEHIYYFKKNLNIDGVLHRIDLINANEEYTNFM